MHFGQVHCWPPASDDRVAHFVWCLVGLILVARRKLVEHNVSGNEAGPPLALWKRLRSHLNSRLGAVLTVCSVSIRCVADRLDDVTRKYGIPVAGF